LALQLQAISILSIILSYTRVSQFPWVSLQEISSVQPIRINDLKNWKQLVQEQQQQQQQQMQDRTTLSNTSPSHDHITDVIEMDGNKVMTITKNKQMKRLPIHDVLNKMLDGFLHGFTLLPIPNNTNKVVPSEVMVVVVLFLNGIETLLLGWCQVGEGGDNGNDNDNYDRLYRRVVSTIRSRADAGDISAAKFLRTLTTQ
jgi:hypothetical protein